MEKVTKWHCAVFERWPQASSIVNGVRASETAHAILSELWRPSNVTGRKYVMYGVTIVLWPLTRAEAIHSEVKVYPAVAHAYGTKKQALRGVLPKALELVAGDMAATIKLMKFVEDNGLDLEEEALE